MPWKPKSFYMSSNKPARSELEEYDAEGTVELGGKAGGDEASSAHEEGTADAYTFRNVM